MTSQPYQDFHHRVGQAINRDILVTCKRQRRKPSDRTILALYPPAPLIA
ncbi:MAG TPA: hypothetical protein VFQ44_14015 [Streptosporangiaceae bacterium]|nr:hypothetical protein [Streptosporangiaceae bacterium]